MTLSPREISFAILAGGAGTRLGGVAKGLITIDDEPIVTRLSRLGARYAETLIVTPDPAPYRFVDARFVTEEQPGVGPVAGILTAIRSARSHWVILVACDMPFVSEAVLERLSGEAGPSSALSFEAGGRTQPFPSIWSTQTAPQVLEALGSTRSLSGVLAHIGARVLPEKELAEVDPELRSVRSLNRLEDVLAAGARLPALAPRSLP